MELVQRHLAQASALVQAARRAGSWQAARLLRAPHLLLQALMLSWKLCALGRALHRGVRSEGPEARAAQCSEVSRESPLHPSASRGVTLCRYTPSEIFDGTGLTTRNSS